MSDDLIRKVKDAELRLIVKEPLLGYTSRRLGLYISRDSQECKGSNGWTDGKSIYLCEGYVASNPPQVIMSTIAHEAMHIVLHHVRRVQELGMEFGAGANPQVYMVLGLLADGIVNEKIRGIGTRPDGIVYCDTLGSMFRDKKVEEICLNKSLEELAHYIFRNHNAQSLPRVRMGRDSMDLKFESNGSGEKDGENGRGNKIVVHHGEEVKDESDITRIFVESAMIAKVAGKYPGWADRVIEYLLKPKVNWSSLLRKYLMGYRVMKSWSKVNRKNEVLPGKRLYGSQRVIVLVDVSGSITKEMFHRFVSELFGILGADAVVEVVFWDTKIQQRELLKRKADIEKVKMVKGGGGTMIREALEYAVKQNGEIIIMSDWAIGDISNPEVVEMLEKNKHRIIAVSMYDEPPSMLKRRIMLKGW